MIRLRATDGSIVLALLPRSAVDSGQAPPPSPPAMAVGMRSPMLSPAAAALPTASAGAGEKSWYLRAARDDLTTDWFKRLEGAGVYATDTVHEAPPRATPQPSAPPSTQPPPARGNIMGNLSFRGNSTSTPRKQPRTVQLPSAKI